MSRIAFAPENRTATTQGFPKLKLEKDERARVLCIEKDPWGKYVHTLRMPRVVNGEVITQILERKDGSKYEDYVMDFVGRPICLGDDQIIASSGGVDVKNCPLCAESTKSDMVEPPSRRFAMNIVKYKTKPGSFEVMNPFSLEIVAWAFTDKVFNKITDFRTEWGNLQEHDLLLGPCGNPQYQQFDIAIAGKAEWMTDNERRALVVETYKQNKADDKTLTELCGRPVQRSWIDADLKKIKDRWAEVRGSEKKEDTVEETSLGADLDDLLDSSDVPAKEAPIDGTGETAPLNEQITETPEDKPGSSGETVMFNDLLGEL